jgi:hypothetical protein
VSITRPSHPKLYIEAADIHSPQCNQLDKEVPMYPVIALVVLTLFTWVVTIWASNGESEEVNDMKNPEQSSDEHNHRKAA